jgi:hypothetical protein
VRDGSFSRARERWKVLDWTLYAEVKVRVGQSFVTTKEFSMPAATKPQIRSLFQTINKQPRMPAASYEDMMREKYLKECIIGTPPLKWIPSDL